jgi:hypothetical protein
MVVKQRHPFTGVGEENSLTKTKQHPFLVLCLYGLPVNPSTNIMDRELQINEVTAVIPRIVVSRGRILALIAEKLAPSAAGLYTMRISGPRGPSPLP